MKQASRAFFVMIEGSKQKYECYGQLKVGRTHMSAERLGLEHVPGVDDCTMSVRLCVRSAGNG